MGKELSVKDRALLQSQGIDIADWRRLRKTWECKTFINVLTGKVMEIRY